MTAESLVKKESSPNISECEDPFLVLDAVVHMIIERNPSESLVKFIQYSLPKLLASQKRSKPE